MSYSDSKRKFIEDKLMEMEGDLEDNPLSVFFNLFGQTDLDPGDGRKTYDELEVEVVALRRDKALAIENLSKYIAKNIVLTGKIHELENQIGILMSQVSK